MAGKTATSVIVSVYPGDIPTMGTSIRLFSRSHTVERAYSSNRYTQCRNCWGFGHLAQRCDSKDPVCRLCSLNHTRANHRCLNPTCPGSGNLKPVLNVVHPPLPAAPTAEKTTLPVIKTVVNNQSPLTQAFPPLTQAFPP